MRPDRFPLTYDECRERFRWTCHLAGLTWSAHPMLDAARRAFSVDRS